MEKIVYLSHQRPSPALVETLLHDRTLCAPCLRFDVSRGQQHVLLSTWFASLERRMPFEARLHELGFVAHAYLVTESRIKRAASAPEASEWLVLLRQTPALGQAELRARTETHLLPAFSRSADDVLCDAVVRPLNLQSPPLRQIWRLQRSTSEADLDLPVQLASIAPAQEVEIERCVTLRT